MAGLSVDAVSLWPTCDVVTIPAATRCVLSHRTSLAGGSCEKLTRRGIGLRALSKQAARQNQVRRSFVARSDHMRTE